MATNDFEEGQMVRLKSGGPTMTVSSTTDAYIHCQWFAGKKLESGNFRRDVLVKVESDE